MHQNGRSCHLQFGVSLAPRVYEIFAGFGTLSVLFESGGWIGAPAIDISICPSLDILNPVLFVVIFGLVLKGRLSFIHLGLRCAFFFSNDVSMDNALAVTTNRIATAQKCDQAFLAIFYNLSC